MKQILVTDSLFIFPEHEKQLQSAGYEVVRLDKPEATQAELIEAVKGKTGYILGGIEKVTDPIIEAADDLKAIVFTGIGYKHFIPGWQLATKKGILIGNVPDGPTHAVAEWAIGAALAANRGFFELQSPSGESFLTTPGLEGQTIGIIALGRIGTRIAEMLEPFRPAKIQYYSTHRHEDVEQRLGLAYAELDNLLRTSDIVFLCVPNDEMPAAYVSIDFIHKMKSHALLVNFNPARIFDVDALFEALKTGHIRAISDYPMDARFDQLPAHAWYSFRASNAFNTTPALAFTSAKATQAMINLLSTGTDEHKVN